MTRKTIVAALAAALPLSSLLVACGGGGDSPDRVALEREALERDLDLALQPDTTGEVLLRDAALLDSAGAAQAPAPQPGTPEAAAPVPAQRAPQASAPSRAAAAPARTAQPSGPRYVTRTVPGGTSFAVRFNNQVSTRTASVGSTFTTTLAEPLLDAQGRTVVPAGATVRGRVTRSVASGGGLGRDAALGVTLTSISYGGERYPISVSGVDVPVRRVSRQSRGQTAATVTGGAAVGAVAGRVLGGSRRDAVIGAVVGGAAGTAVAVGSHDVDAVISAGSTGTVRLDGPVRVRKEAS